jgi:hypothetical protein
MEQMLAGVAGQRVGLYIYSDSSPQLRGAELYATSMDVLDVNGGYFARRQLPCVSLERCMFSARGKIFGLLWQLFLIAGPTLAAMHMLCRRVRGVITDMGTERKLADAPNVLGEFMRLLGSKEPLPAGSDASPYLFEYAVSVPGWRHAVDLLVQKSLGSQVWWPKWIAAFKAHSLASRSSRTQLHSRLGMSARGLPMMLAIFRRKPRPASWFGHGHGAISRLADVACFRGHGQGMCLRSLRSHGSTGGFRSALLSGCPVCKRFAVLQNGSRSRSIVLQVDRFGQQASAIYLSCWAARAHLTREAHRRYRPSVADMEAHVAAGLEW